MFRIKMAIGNRLSALIATQQNLSLNDFIHKPFYGWYRKVARLD